MVACSLVWILLVQPAWRTLREAPAQLDRLDAQLQQMQRLAAESQTPARRRAGVAGPGRRGAEGRHRRGSATRPASSLQGERATLTLNGVDAEALRGWLAEARSAARARPVEAQLARGPQGYSGTRRS